MQYGGAVMTYLSRTARFFNHIEDPDFFGAAGLIHFRL